MLQHLFIHSSSLTLFILISIRPLIEFLMFFYLISVIILDFILRQVLSKVLQIDLPSFLS
jgi:hypothetical protein